MQAPYPPNQEGTFCSCMVADDEQPGQPNLGRCAAEASSSNTRQFRGFILNNNTQYAPRALLLNTSHVTHFPSCRYCVQSPSLGHASTTVFRDRLTVAGGMTYCRNRAALRFDFRPSRPIHGSFIISASRILQRAERARTAWYSIRTEAPVAILPPGHGRTTCSPSICHQPSLRHQRAHLRGLHDPRPTAQVQPPSNPSLHSADSSQATCWLMVRETTPCSHDPVTHTHTTPAQLFCVSWLAHLSQLRHLHSGGPRSI